eukprot:1597642-Amphidinium_carterae.1
MDDTRAIDDAEVLRVWSELSELDPKIKGDTYVTEDGSQWNFSDLVDDVRVLRERRESARAAGVGGPSATPGGAEVVEVPMEVGTSRKRVAEEEADDGERAARGATDLAVLEPVGRRGKGMLALSLLLSDGATILPGIRSQEELHDQFSDGRGCYYLHLSTLDTAVTVEEPGVQVVWNKPKTQCFYDEYTGMELP